MLQYIIIVNSSGVVRLSKWYVPLERDEKQRLQKEVFQLVSRRKPTQSNIIEFRNNKIVFRQYEKVYFCFVIDNSDNELAYLESIHRFVEVLDAYFTRVREPHLSFFFNKVYCILDEMFLAGEIHETSTNVILEQVWELDEYL